jgi:hypothetical protein
MIWNIFMETDIHAIDSTAVIFETVCGRVIVAPGLQGRVICELENEMIHRFDRDIACNPVPGEFNNVGGNSLWPAPEGGEFGFNYHPETDEWYVQASINEQPAEIVHHFESEVMIARTIDLVARRGDIFKMRWSRVVEPLEVNNSAESGVNAVGYRTLDAFEPMEDYAADTTPVAAWSLEQFPLGAGAIAFGRTEKKAAGSVNTDFYGDPEPRLAYSDEFFVFKLGGNERLQIGVKSVSEPQLIGSFDPDKLLLIIRRTDTQDGRYVNIADNDQPDGPFSAADMYSVFNGGDELAFYELETIAPMQVKDGLFKGSFLPSETIIAKGGYENLSAWAKKEFNISLNEICKLGGLK